MASIEFKYKIKPVTNPLLANSDGYSLNYSTESNWDPQPSKIFSLEAEKRSAEYDF